MKVTVNEFNQPVGEFHGRAKWTDSEAELVRELHDEGWGYKRISQKMEMPRSTVRAICRGDIRCTKSWREREERHHGK